MFEVEVRGEIKNFEKVYSMFKKSADFIKEKDRFTLLYFRDTDFEGDKLKEILQNDPVDFKIRVTDKKAEIVLKHGLVKGSESRREILIPIDLDKFDEAVDLFKFLGWKNGVIMATKTYVFNYKGIEFALVKTKGFDYFEAEVVVEKKESSKEAMEKIKQVCSDLGLKEFGENEFIEFLDKMNQRKEFVFDLTKQNFREIKENFKDYF